MAHQIIDARVRERAKEMALDECEHDITTLFREDIDLPTLREVAYSMWNQLVQLYEEGLVEPQQGFRDVNEFIRSIKEKGVPEEIRDNKEHLLRVLGAGEATLYEKEDALSPLLRRVTARHGTLRTDRKLPFTRAEGLPFKRMSEDELPELYPKRHGGEPFFHLPDIEYTVERAGDTIYVELDAPKDEAGNYVCGWPLVVAGIIPPGLKACVIDSYPNNDRIAAMLKRPVAKEFVDSPGVRKGAEKCIWRYHLRPTLAVIPT